MIKTNLFSILLILLMFRWKQFNLRALNYELSTPLSPAQLKLNRATGVGDGVS
jgi:hypothetical protein